MLGVKNVVFEKQSVAVILSALLVTACGGGGGGGGSTPSVVRPTSITGTVTPPVAPISGSPLFISPNVLTAPNTISTWISIVQGMDYTFDPVAAAATPSLLKVATLNIKPVGTEANNTFRIVTGGAYPADPGLGQTTQVEPGIAVNSLVFGNTTQITVFNTALGAIVSLNTLLGGRPTVTLVDNAALSAVGYVLPYSATLNPAGYSYQTFGVWATYTGPAAHTEYYFSAGGVTDPATLPITGTASYTGFAVGSLVDAASRDPGDTTATMNATADFAARTVAFSTTGTTSLSNNAAPGAVASANPGLNMSGTLSYAAGSNTFTGSVTTVNGMSGNATGRFYGPGIGAPTGTKVAGSPPEIGGTFAVMSTSGAMHGAFGGN
ncbi:MAG: hypothetical protein HYZ46_08890 [Nitrosomonadales bacterium]|nr:hypothetical protein [Nitrosomonadales bacterium]